MQRTEAISRSAAAVGPLRATLAGTSASLVGIGLARFAYTPLIPALIAAGWFAPAAAVYLGAANLAGYLAGALFGRRLLAWATPPTVLRGMMLIATAAFFACAWPQSFAWYFVWRVAAGVAGGALMVLAAPTVLPHVPAGRRGLAGGAIFTGVGLGIAASGTLVPLLLGYGLAVTWCGLGVLSLALTLGAWGGWPADPAGTSPARPSPSDVRPPAGPARWALWAVCVAYGLNAAGLVPHMVFLVDFIARGLALGLAVGAWYWVLFGAGALAGPLLAGALADRIGFAAALRAALAAQAAAVALPALSTGTAALTVSALVTGAFVPGVVPLVLGRVQQLAGPDGAAQRAAWSYATTAFAVGQAAAAYGFSYLFARTGGYGPLFTLGAAALLAALALEIVGTRGARS
jgi:predicted MFS family arabinose efflux permease